MVATNHPLHRRQARGPGFLKIEGGTRYEIAQQKSKRKDTTRLFCDILDVEHAQIQQINGEIEPNFLQALCNLITGKINRTISEIFDYIYSNFRNVSADKLSNLKDTTKI